MRSLSNYLQVLIRINLPLFTLIFKINKTKNEKNITITAIIPLKNNIFALNNFYGI